MSSLFHMTPEALVDFATNLKSFNAGIGHWPADVVKAVQDIKASVAGATYDVFIKPDDIGTKLVETVANSRHEFVKATVNTSNLFEVATALGGAAGLAFKRLFNLPSSQPLSHTAEKLAQTAQLQQNQIKQLLAPAEQTVVSRLSVPRSGLTL